MNDPNGLVFRDGWWHLFYQHHPDSLEWGPMHWGHAISRDLHAWQDRPIALAPDELGTIFSGSAALDQNGAIVACFTHHGENGEVQGLAFSPDGDTFEKWSGNPVLDIGRRDFRDPKIFRYGNAWRMIVAALETAQIYESSDLKSWRLLSELPTPFDNWGWECPDLFGLDGRWILIGSFLVPDAPHQSCYWIGDFDGENFRAQSGPHSLSFGPDDYAAVSWNNAPDDRRVLIGWMNAWVYANQTPATEFRGVLTLPRDLSLITTPDGPRLAQSPTPELQKWRAEPRNTAPASGAFEAEIRWQRGASDCVLEWNGLRVGCDWEQNELFLDRSSAQLHPHFNSVYRARFVGDELKLRVFVDTQSVEVFAADGLFYGAALWFGQVSSFNFSGGEITIWPLRKPQES